MRPVSCCATRSPRRPKTCARKFVTPSAEKSTETGYTPKPVPELTLRPRTVQSNWSGTLNGVPDQLLCTVRGRKVSSGTGFGVYPVSVDFSALGVTNFLAQVFGRLGDLVAQQETGLIEPVLRTDFNGYHV